MSVDISDEITALNSQTLLGLPTDHLPVKQHRSVFHFRGVVVAFYCFSFTVFDFLTSGLIVVLNSFLAFRFLTSHLAGGYR